MSRRSERMSFVSARMSRRSWHASQFPVGDAPCAQAVRHEASSSAAEVKTLFVNASLIWLISSVLKISVSARRRRRAPLGNSRAPASAEVMEERHTTPARRARTRRARAEGVLQTASATSRFLRRVHLSRGRTFSPPPRERFLPPRPLRYTPARAARSKNKTAPKGWQGDALRVLRRGAGGRAEALG